MPVGWMYTDPSGTQSNIVDLNLNPVSTTKTYKVQIGDTSESGDLKGDTTLDNDKDSDKKTVKVPDPTVNVKWWGLKDHTLTIYKHDMNSEDFNGNINPSSSDWPWNDVRDQVNHIIFDGKVSSKNGSVSNMFAYMPNLTKIDGLDKLQTDNVNNFQNMFLNDTKLETLDANLINVDNATNLQSMFEGLDSIKKLDVSNWNIHGAVNLTRLFYYDNNLLQLDLSNWNTTDKKVVETNMLKMSAKFNLWKIKFGNYSYLISDCGLSNPPDDGNPMPENPDIPNTEATWTIVGEGSDYDPIGDICTAKNVIDNSQKATAPFTVVWSN
ncbi:BspA family leucine-rich repeat surface protein [Bombilactobacillus thymidiniphilus]|uniref:DUF285 domain-containing protein n=1 Tax=Bombilactobacillus thymidiniphilus TaxID=2923363 RepID=A0ABY4PD04_9LACO|nr:BspA family leucine-rich repeat surface protein [Bombilactobacillus thymidiniphilus]UQS83157.1 DUF285 domain-containing protein [Bombilactobacillus thymidiniphilus]